MRIRSPFKDYYDIGLGLGHDAADDVLYVRVPRELRNDTRPRFRSLDTADFQVDHLVIGFCGRCYPGLIVCPRSGSGGGATYAYSADEFAGMVESVASKKERERFFARRGYDLFGATAASVRNWFGSRDVAGAWHSRLTGLFAEHNVPIFVRDESLGTLTLNAALRPYNFARIVDPYTAWQEVSAYVGGVLNARREVVPPVSDSDLAAAKGFDEWSFRKPPSDSRPARKRRR